MQKLPLLFLLVFLLFAQIGISQNEVELDEIQPEAPPTTTPAVDMNAGKIESDVNNKAHIYESDESMSKGIQNAIIVETVSKDEKLVEDVWKKFIKDYGGKTKKSKGGKNEFTTTGAEIVGINGVNSLNVYSSAGTGASGNIEMRIWFDMGEEYLESNRTSQYAEAERMLQKFAHEVKIENTKEELKTAEKDLKNYESELKSLRNKNESLHKDIENYEKKIEEAKENIITNEEQQLDTGKKIELQGQLIEEIDRRLRSLRKQ
ncbi:MAG: hypothetical protein R2825_17925 [Saprospiraceae bacterium]